MKAIFYDEYKSADVLEFRDIDTPAIGGDQVLVRVHAASVNRGDGLTVEGIPYAARFTYGLMRPKYNVPGTDLAGRVEAVGKDVTTLEPGDDVFGWATGAFAEYATAPSSMLMPKPANLTFEQAAAAPTAAVAALQGLHDVGQIKPGHHVLVVGASGGVGTFATQIAKAFGAEVTGVASTRNVDLVRSAGADHVVDYTREDFTTHRRRYDLILDMVGMAPLSVGRRASKRNGVYVVVGGGNPRSVTGMGRFAKATLLSPFVPQRIRPLFSKQNRHDLEVISDLLGAGKLLPVIDAVYDLTGGAEAIRYVHAGHARGKVVITV